MDQLSTQELTTFMKNYLVENGSISSEIQIEASTDLVALGIESIQLLTMLTIIEKNFQLSISIDKLEKHHFSFSANTLLDIVD